MEPTKQQTEVDAAIDVLLASKGRLLAAIDTLRQRNKEAIEREIVAGEKSYEAIAREFAVSSQYVYRVAAAKGIRREKDAMTPEVAGE